MDFIHIGYHKTGTTFLQYNLFQNHHDIWIGSKSFIRRGVIIGTGAVIGACSVVTKPVPPYAIIVGNPAKIVKYRFPPYVIDALLESEWWNFEPDKAKIIINQIIK